VPDGAWEVHLVKTSSDYFCIVQQVDNLSLERDISTLWHKMSEYEIAQLDTIQLNDTQCAAHSYVVYRTHTS
jgi:hypothetical protein